MNMPFVTFEVNDKNQPTLTTLSKLDTSNDMQNSAQHCRKLLLLHKR